MIKLTTCLTAVPHKSNRVAENETYAKKRSMLHSYILLISPNSNFDIAPTGERS